MIKSFEKNLMEKAHDYKQRTLSLLYCKSSTKIRNESSSVDPMNDCYKEFSSPRMLKNHQEIVITPPTFQKVHKYRTNLSQQTLNGLKLNFSIENKENYEF